MYYSGVVNSYDDLRTALFNACTGNGWVLTDNVLSKGTIFIQVTVSTATSGNPGPGLIFRAATGYSGGSLIGASPQRPRLGRPSYSSENPVFPIQYFIHVFENTDEVYLFTKFNLEYFHYAAFGKSTLVLPGTGTWLSATARYDVHSSNGVSIGDTNSGTVTPGAIFWATQGAITADTSSDAIHVNIDGTEWALASASGLTSPGRVCAIAAAIPMVSYGLNTWNGSAPLIRIRGLFFRASNKSSLVCDLQNARYIRNDNFAAGEVITLGTEQWCVYPWYRKNTTERNGGGNSITPHSGTLAIAVRYDGP